MGAITAPCPGVLTGLVRLRHAVGAGNCVRADRLATCPAPVTAYLMVLARRGGWKGAWDSGDREWGTEGARESLKNEGNGGHIGVSIVTKIIPLFYGLGTPPSSTSCWGVHVKATPHGG